MKEAKTIRAIMFDLDNTLIDFLTFKKETAMAAAKEMVRHGLPCSEITAYGKIFSVYDEKGIEYQKTFSDVVRSFDLDVNLGEKIQQAGIIAYLKKKFQVLRPYPSVKSTLARLRYRYALCIVTDAPRNKAWQRLIITGLENEFDYVITHDDTMNFKPHPSPFNLALKKLNLLPGACMFVGDNNEHDVVGAKDLGLITCWARYGSSKKTKSDADFEIDALEDILKYL